MEAVVVDTAEAVVDTEIDTRGVYYIVKKQRVVSARCFLLNVNLLLWHSLLIGGELLVLFHVSL